LRRCYARANQVETVAPRSAGSHSSSDVMSVWSGEDAVARTESELGPVDLLVAKDGSAAPARRSRIPTSGGTRRR